MITLTSQIAIVPPPPEPPPREFGNITNPLLPLHLQQIDGVEYLKKIVPSLIGLILVVGVVIFLFVFLIGAIQWIMSGGDKAAVETARGKISNALIGLVVLFATFAIIALIEQFFGVNILTLDIGVLRIE